MAKITPVLKQTAERARNVLLWELRKHSRVDTGLLRSRFRRKGQFEVANSVWYGKYVWRRYPETVEIPLQKATEYIYRQFYRDLERIDFNDLTNTKSIDTRALGIIKNNPSARQRKLDIKTRRGLKATRTVIPLPKRRH